MEEWRTIQGVGGCEVSNLGRVRNKNTLKIIKQYPKDGFRYVQLYNCGTSREYYVHDLVAGEFLCWWEVDRNPDGSPMTSMPEVYHLNLKGCDNRVENLGICDRRYHNMMLMFHKIEEKVDQEFLDKWEKKYEQDCD